MKKLSSAETNATQRPASGEVWVSCAWPTTEYVPFPDQDKAVKITQNPVKLSRADANKLTEHVLATKSHVQLIVEDVK